VSHEKNCNHFDRSGNCDTDLIMRANGHACHNGSIITSPWISPVSSAAPARPASSCFVLAVYTNGPSPATIHESMFNNRNLNAR
jgi:hypothetical protein